MNFENYFFIEHRDLPIDLENISEDKVLLNGLLPNLIFQLLETTNKDIYFIGDFNFNLAKQNWSSKSHRFYQYKEETNISSSAPFDAFIFEGETNFFSGIDIFSSIMKEIDPKGEKTFVVPHFYSGKYPPNRYFSDYHDHLHRDNKYWEDFYFENVSWLNKDQIINSSKDFEPKFQNPLIVLPNISYHQPIYSFSTKLIRNGATIFTSERSPYTSFTNSGYIFDSFDLINYSPFEPNSYYSKKSISRLSKRLKDIVNV